MSETIADRLSANTSSVAKVAVAARNGDQDGFVRQLSSLLVSVATGIPGLGVLAGEAGSKAFALSSYGRMQQALAHLEVEQHEDALVRRTIEELEARLVVAEAVTTKSLVPAGWEDFSQAFVSALASADVLVASIVATDGATGIEVSPGGRRRLVAGEVRASGRGSVGVRV